MNTFIDIAKQKINESYKKNEITNEGLYHYLFDILTEADKAIQVQARVSPKVADITRIVVIDHQKKNCENFGRIVDEWNIKLNFSYQDDNKTLKVIISDR